MKALILLSLPLAVVWGSGCSTGNGNDPVSAAQSPKITQSETSAAEPCETCDSEEEVAVADLPAAVSAAALSAVPGGTIAEAVRETEAGVVVYEVGVATAEGDFEVEVSEAGEVLEVEAEGADDEDGDEDGEDDEEEIAVADLPAVVAAAALSAVPGGTIVEAERETEAGVVVYEVEVETAAGEFEVEVSEAGEVLEVEAEDEDDEDDDD